MTPRLLFLLPILLVALIGCRRGEVQEVKRNADGTWDVTMRYTEADFTDMIDAALLASGNPLLRDPQIDLQNGQVVITGEHDKRDGSGDRVSGIMTATVTVQNGALLFQVTSADFQGAPVTQSDIDTFNANAKARMEMRAATEGRVTQMLTVEMTQDYVDITFNVDRRSQG